MVLQVTLGTIHISRKQKEWVGGVGQMLTFAYIVGGWAKAKAYISKLQEIYETFMIMKRAPTAAVNLKPLHVMKYIDLTRWLT